MAESKSKTKTSTETTTTEITPKRGRGHPKGAGGYKRPDSTVQAEPGDNRKYLEHNLKMWKWPSVDMKKPENVLERVTLYFQTCADDDMKPSVAGLALAFGIDRRTLWKWINGIQSDFVAAESRDALKKAYQILNAQMENYMQNGKINPVAGIFLMKNNMGYQDKQEVVVTPNQQLGEQIPAEKLEQKYLEDVIGVSASDYEVDSWATMPSNYGGFTTMIQLDGEAEQLSLDYWEKANDYRWIISDYRATIERLSDHRQGELPLQQFLAGAADENRKKENRLIPKI